MALSSHLEAVLNGMFLVLLGLFWPHVGLPHAWGVTAIALIVYADLRELVGDAARRAVGCRPQACADRGGRPEASAAKEGVVSFLLVSLSVAIVVGIVIIIVGI